MKSGILALSLVLGLGMQSFAQKTPADTISFKNKELVIQPINHATFALTYDKKTVYVDPTGGAIAFTGIAPPDLILITDIHGDHLDTATLKAVIQSKTKIIVPQAVADKLPSSIKKNQVTILVNGETEKFAGMEVLAVPMYNLPQTADAFHTKGRGNGYVLSADGGRLYISGDTEDIPEMRNLENIDIAFVCMNLPYTMDAKQAADGVIAFAPKIVYPYHYRGQDTKLFKEIVNNQAPSIDVRLRNWYPAK